MGCWAGLPRSSPVLLGGSVPRVSTEGPGCSVSSPSPCRLWNPQDSQLPGTVPEPLWGLARTHL